MQEIDLALEMLHAILDEKVPFSEALRRRFQSDLAVRPMRQDVAGIVGCELRHHLLFRYVLKADFPEEDKMRLVALALANHYFFRRFPAEKVFAVLADALTEEEIAKVRPYLEGNRGADELLGENMRHTSNLYLSLRYNTPEWVLKIFQHYGYGQTYKILRSYARPRQNVVRVLTEEVTMEDLCSGGEFAPSKAYPDLIADHTGKTSLRKFPAYRSGAFFDIKPFFHKILLDHPVDAPRQILLYNGNPMSGFERDLIALYGDRIGLNVACPSVEKRPEVSRLIRGKKLRNVNFFSAPNGDGFASAVSTKQDLVILAPESTNFDDIPTSPDFLLRFDKEGMDRIIAGEAALLQNAASCVEEGGTLIYVIFTISKKEGDRAIGEFLAKNPEFALTSKRQYFPFEEESFHAGVFYAEMKKGNAPLALSAPLLSSGEASAAKTRAYAAGQGE